MSALRYSIRRGWSPGDLGWVVTEHGRYYADSWQLGAGFEAKVAEAMGVWMQRYDSRRDLLLIAEDENGRLGSISLDGSGAHAASEGARIRFFILGGRARGHGIGKALMREMMDFIRSAGFSRAFLTTFKGLDAARALYEAEGFVLLEETLDESWGRPLAEQRFEWRA